MEASNSVAENEDQDRIAKNFLTFGLLEDVMFLSSDRYRAIVDNAAILRIGPLVEYAYHHYSDRDDSIAKRCETTAALQRTLNLRDLHQHPHNASSRPRVCEFFRSPQTIIDSDDRHWLLFCMRLANAAMAAGLSRQFSHALAGTFGEMTGNLIEHSQRPGSGLVGYRWKAGEFEYVVADAGIGVLDSLRSHGDYSWILDSGDALQLATSDGVSRFGKAAHRGTGFHNLLYNIANRNSYIRFRSGDHAYLIDGSDGLPKKTTRPCAPFPGLLISVVSRPFRSANLVIDNSQSPSHYAH